MRVRMLALLTATAAVLAGLSLPAVAAAPGSAPTVTVTRLAVGFRVTWTGVPGATGYRLFYETPVRQDQGGAGYLVVGSRMSVLANVSGSARSFTTADLHSPETNLFTYSLKLSVAGTNSSGVGPQGGNRARCAAGYFVAARGSGQNPKDGSYSSYANGLGDRGARVYEDARKRLGLSRSQFPANAVNYPAAAVSWRFIDRQNYDSSKNNGVSVTMSHLNNIASRCPNARVVTFGYSQGAHAVGDAVQKVSTTTRNHVMLLMLFADAARNPNDTGISHRPLRSSGHGIMGTRAAFTGLTDRLQVSTWCLAADDVCSVDSYPTTFHGPAYDCYEKWAAETIAARARTRGWRTSANITHPTCQMVV